ncbi:2-oxoacid:acceptor oxidoreductase family protein [Patescibacteria group bacterium]
MLDSAKIIVSGTGGQGVKSLVNILGDLLIQADYDVSVLVNYDSASRGGTIYAYVVFDKDKVENPIVDEADFLLELAKTPQEFQAKQNICAQDVNSDADNYDFFGLGQEKFGKPIYGNSIALGTLLAYLEADLSKFDIRKAMPKKLPDDNVDAVQAGYKLKS